MDGLLFPPSEMELRRTGAALLAEIARRPAAPLTARERRRDEERRTIERLAREGAELARTFGLRTPRIETEPDGTADHYGICYEDGLIRIRLRHRTTGKLLKDSSLVDTLCHELAHLRHMNHGLSFRRLYARILEQARLSGAYRPGAMERQRPVQGELFDGPRCAVRRRR
jgi:hypothetical protein